MTVLKSINDRVLFIGQLYDEAGRLRLWKFLMIMSVFGIIALGEFAGSYFDGTLNLPGNGRGLLNHWGVWAFLVTNPIIIGLTIFISLLSVKILLNFEKYAIKNDSISIMLARRHALSLVGYGRYIYILYLFIIIGIMATIVNIKQTQNPVPIYGNDVFDAVYYPFGFLANKINLFITWSIVYPLAIYVSGHATVSLYFVAKIAHKDKSMKVDFFHPDCCGGLSEFGKINFLIMAVYACFFSVIMALAKTHANRYTSLEVPLVVASFVFIVHSIVGVYYVHKIVDNAKNEEQHKLSFYINNYIIQNRCEDLPSSMIALYTHVSKVNTYPYTNAISILVNALRAAPALLAVIGRST